MSYEILTTKMVYYGAAFISLTVVITLIFGDYIVYLSKCKKGYKVEAIMVEVDYLNDMPRRRYAVSVFEYLFNNKKCLAVLPYIPLDQIGQRTCIYIRESYVVRKKINPYKDYTGLSIFIIIEIIVLFYYIIHQWNGFEDVIACIAVVSCVIIFIFVYPLLYKWQISHIKKSLGWHENL